MTDTENIKRTAKSMQGEVSLFDMAKLAHEDNYLLKHIKQSSPAYDSAENISKIIDAVNNKKMSKQTAESKLQTEIGGIFMFA